MFDFKYHIVSLVAVFLALGIGVVMGSMSAERGVVTDQEKALITTMEKDFEKLRADNTELNSIVAADAAFQAGATALLTNGMLTGKNVAVVVTGNAEAEALKNLKSELEQAGGKEQSVTTFSGNLGLDDKAILEKVTAIVNGQGTGQAAVRAKALDETARAIGSGINAKAISDLAAAGFMKTEGSYDIPIQCVVIVGGTANGNNLKPADLDTVLIKSLLTLPLTMVGTESSTVKNSYMKTYEDLGISTVDNVDTAAGRVSTVFVLSGQAGNFGTRSTAGKLMPEPPKSQ